MLEIFNIKFLTTENILYTIAGMLIVILISSLFSKSKYGIKEILHINNDDLWDILKCGTQVSFYNENHNIIIDINANLHSIDSTVYFIITILLSNGIPIEGELLAQITKEIKYFKNPKFNKPITIPIPEDKLKDFNKAVTLINQTFSDLKKEYVKKH